MQYDSQLEAEEYENEHWGWIYYAFYPSYYSFQQFFLNLHNMLNILLKIQKICS